MCCFLHQFLHIKIQADNLFLKKKYDNVPYHCVLSFSANLRTLNDFSVGVLLVNTLAKVESSSLILKDFNYVKVLSICFSILFYIFFIICMHDKVYRHSVIK